MPPLYSSFRCSTIAQFIVDIQIVFPIQVEVDHRLIYPAVRYDLKPCNCQWERHTHSL